MSELTSDNQPTQSFDEKLNEILFGLAKRVEQMQRGKTYGVWPELAAIKAAIVEARPERDRIYNESGYDPKHRRLFNGALDEWSKNMGILPE